ncbi:MAG: glycosyltransferase family protein [Saprospiraceae bacterium]
MKILYAIQGTGNGHMSRAMEFLPELTRHVDTDVLLSGTQSEIKLNFPVKYRLHGASFIFGTNGGINYQATWRTNSLVRILNEIKACPVSHYDFILNDFEPITAWAAKWRGVPCYSLSHQSALLSEAVPKPPRKDRIGQLVLSGYAPCSKRFGFHFYSYDKDVFLPMIRKEVRHATISNQGHYTVYLPFYSDEKIVAVLSRLPSCQWLIFSKHASTSYTKANCTIQPINSQEFIQSISSGAGVLCGAGFETPAEALFLQKKLLVIPMKGQYEQGINAMSLKQMGIPIATKLDASSLPVIRDWVNKDQLISVNYPDQSSEIIHRILEYHWSKQPAGQLGRLEELA